MGHPFYTTLSFVQQHFKPMGEFKLELQSGNAQFGSKSVIFVPCDLEIWWMTLKNNRVPLLYHVKLCTSFQSHHWIQTGVTVRKRPIRVKIGNFCPLWPWNLMDDLEKQQGTSSIPRKALYIFSKPSLNSNWSYSPETPNSGQNQWFFWLLWPCNLMDDPEKQQGTSSIPRKALYIFSKPSLNSNWSYSPETPNSGQNQWFFWLLWPYNLMDDFEKQQGTSSIPHLALCIISKPFVYSSLSCSPEMHNLAQNRGFFVIYDLEIWQMTMKNNRAPPLCSFKLCASFHSNHWIQTGVIPQKHLIWVKMDNFFSCVTFKFDRWPWKTILHLSYITSSFVHHFITIYMNSNWNCQKGVTDGRTGRRTDRQADRDTHT